MARPVHGFLSVDGQFFETKEACDAYESHRAVKAIIVQRLSKAADLTDNGLNYMTAVVFAMLDENLDAFGDYVYTHQNVTTTKQEPPPPNDIRASEIGPALAEVVPEPPTAQ